MTYCVSCSCKSEGGSLSCIWCNSGKKGRDCPKCRNGKI